MLLKALTFRNHTFHVLVITKIKSQVSAITSEEDETKANQNNQSPNVPDQVPTPKKPHLVNLVSQTSVI